MAALVAGPTAAAQRPEPPSLEPMERLGFLVGIWEGEGWMEYQPGRKATFTIRIEDGDWVEVGDASRDGGESWHRFFEMRLSRKCLAGARRTGGECGSLPSPRR